VLTHVILPQTAIIFLAFLPVLGLVRLAGTAMSWPRNMLSLTTILVKPFAGR
jgi:hypothetical protein